MATVGKTKKKKPANGIFTLIFHTDDMVKIYEVFEREREKNTPFPLELLIDR